MGAWCVARGTMSAPAPLDAPTTALVRVAAAIALSDDAALRDRMKAARGAGVPALWMEELLLQSLLNVGYPLTLVAFAVWREVAGPVEDKGEPIADAGRGGHGARFGRSRLASRARVEDLGAVGGCAEPKPLMRNADSRNCGFRIADCGLTGWVRDARRADGSNQGVRLGSRRFGRGVTPRPDHGSARKATAAGWDVGRGELSSGVPRPVAQGVYREDGDRRRGSG